mmetsp:Transcript_128216/g.239953  ORF Transcript_128216/g.239953 Transcript_128216/m.239953 type:complete len:213 (+) Transcript_128216:430-1068(+)
MDSALPGISSLAVTGNSGKSNQACIQRPLWQLTGLNAALGKQNCTQGNRFFSAFCHFIQSSLEPLRPCSQITKAEYAKSNVGGFNSGGAVRGSSLSSKQSNCTTPRGTTETKVRLNTTSTPPDAIRVLPGCTVSIASSSDPNAAKIGVSSLQTSRVPARKFSLSLETITGKLTLFAMDRAMSAALAASAAQAATRSAVACVPGDLDSCTVDA